MASTSSPFVRADSSNLPKVDLFMMVDYMKISDKYNDIELRGAKAMMSSRDSYLDNAVGYVELKREMRLCQVSARVVPEHRVSQKPYKVTVKIDEANEKIIDATCDDCPASEGGCKHSLVLLFWLQKKSSEPSPTSVQSYWTKPALGSLRNHYVLAENIFSRANNTTKLKRDPRNANVLKEFLEESKNHSNSGRGLVVSHSSMNNNVSYCIYNLLLQYNKQFGSTNYDDFKNYCDSVITQHVKQEIEQKTADQVSSLYWHNIRQGRITASRLYEVSKCNTDGALVKEILGGYKIVETKAMQRGKNLEASIITKLEKTFKSKINKVGFFMYNTIFGASPDGIFENKKYIIEIKCPSKESTVKNYIKDNKISDKCLAQVQLQMLCTNIKKCLFCVADVNYETNNNITILFIDYDDDYIKNVINDAENFYKKYVYPKILRSVSLNM